jgi:ElaB/YqjD/DUF883 family membrane-anchored ribosome-binding protein
MSVFTNPNEKKSDESHFKSVTGKNQVSNGIIETLSHNVGRDMGLAAGNASKKASEYMQNTRHYVEHNPIKGIAFAAAAGLAVGSILTMATRRSK